MYVHMCVHAYVDMCMPTHKHACIHAYITDAIIIIFIDEEHVIAALVRLEMVKNM
jgi:hypothetical protein